MKMRGVFAEKSFGNSLKIRPKPSLSFGKVRFSGNYLSRGRNQHPAVGINFRESHWKSRIFSTFILKNGF